MMISLDFDTCFPLIAALTSLLTAQTLKTILFFFNRNVNVNIKTLFTAGGMPSTHSAFVVGLTTAMGIQHGIPSDQFSISFVLAAIVLYDATGIRNAVGKQAIIVNKIADDYKKQKKLESERLSELLGHTPQEVCAGVLTGISVTVLIYLV